MSLQPKRRVTPTDYAKKGASSKRVKKALNNPVCSCACRVPFYVLFRLVLAFWSLVKNDQDSLLWAIQHESGSQRKKQWFLAGLVANLYYIMFSK